MTPMPGPGSTPRQPAVDIAAFTTLGVVCAHPDDETFGLGATISTLVDGGTRAALACLTRGESSTLGAGEDLARRRTDELRCAAEVLGIDVVEVLDHPDGQLADVPLARLIDDACTAVGDPDVLLTFDEGGITGHPDHQRATDTAVAAGRRLGVPVLGWALPEQVAARLREEFDAPFVGRASGDLHHRLRVDRGRQRRAIACHASQDNPVPHRRIELQGPYEHLRVLHRPAIRHDTSDQPRQETRP